MAARSVMEYPKVGHWMCYGKTVFFCLVSIIQTGAPWKQIQFTFNASMDRTEHIAKLMRGCGHPEWRWWRHFLIRQIPGAQFNWWKMQLLMWNYSN